MGVTNVRDSLLWFLILLSVWRTCISSTDNILEAGRKENWITVKFEQRHNQFMVRQLSFSLNPCWSLSVPQENAPISSVWTL